MIHLHTRSCYSLLESSLDIDEIIRLAKESGQKAVALTDHRSMFASMEFLHAAKAAGLKPILGLEFEVRKDEQVFSLLALARNTTGLQNLYALSTRLLSGEDILPLEELHKYSEGIIIMNAGGDDLLESFAHEGDTAALTGFFAALKQEVPAVFLAISIQDSPRFFNSNQTMKQTAKALHLPSVALSRIEYEKPEDEQTLRLLQAIAKNKPVDDPSLRVRKGRWWRSPDEMEELYDPSDLAMSDQIADCIEEYVIPKASLPHFVNKAGCSSAEYLKSLCHAGLKKRCQGHIPKDYMERLQHELNIILSMGFADYFLIVWDFIRESRSRGILVGPGRGSAAGSLVAYCLGITHIDPIKSHLLFERFLNPSRISMPDIDTDFPDNRRDEIIEYVQDLYGRYHAAHIVTFARMKAKLALRDSARAMNIPMRDAEKLTSLIPTGSNMSLKEAYSSLRAFSSLVDNSAALKRLYEAACKIEGLPRHASTHAGGIVLSKEQILQQAPLIETGEALPAVQFTMDYLEEIGLIKFDFLALRNLTTLAEISEDVRQFTGRPLDLLKLPLNDPAVYQLLRNGDTLGIFQLESAGIRNLILRYRPNSFEDIAAILALYRPGPMKNIDLFLNARFHPEQRQSIHPLLDSLLAETGGIFVYQEQIMEAARIIGGFSLAEADSLRKAMSKKKRDVMESWKQKFIEGAALKQIPAGQADQIFETMAQFADYGFNKSHSYAYGLIVYQMSWLKAHYPLQFYKACLNACMGSGAKSQSFFKECAGRRLSIAPISLNRSQAVYQIDGQALRMPFSLVKTVSLQASEKIIAEREAHGPFTDPAISILRLLFAGLNQSQVLNLIHAGAFDELQAGREALAAAFEEIVRLEDLVILNPATGTFQFSGVTPPAIPDQPVDAMQRLLKEKELLGFYVSKHPAALLREANPTLTAIADAQSKMGFLNMAGILHGIHNHKTRKGDAMAFASLSDEGATIDLAIMPNVFERLQPLLKNNTLVIIEGRKQRKDSLLVNNIILADSLPRR